MNPAVISMLHISLSVSPNKMFQIIGHIKSIDRQLKTTILEVITVDYSKVNDNTDHFKLSIYGNIKTLADKILSREDLIFATGQLNTGVDCENVVFEVKHFLSWNGMRNIFEAPSTAIPPKDPFDEKMAY